MNTLASGLQAALLLARGRPDGLALLTTEPDAGMDVARRSFWALPVALPGFVALHAMDWVAERHSGVPAGGFAHGFAQDLLGFVIGWVGFCLLSHRLAEVSGRRVLWPRFIAAWNWCNVIQYMMLVVAGLPALLGFPGWMVETLWLVGTGWALWLEYFTARLALGLPRPMAIALVTLDVGLGIAIALIMAGVG